MNQAHERVLRILDYLEPRIDLEHVAMARARQRAALDFAPVDRAPLVFYLPYTATQFAPYPYPEAFADPAKMMVNELLVGFTSLYHAVELRDDAPYCLRPNLGTTLVASVFGAEIRLVEDNPPWVIPFDSADRLRAIAGAPLPDPCTGLIPRVLEQYEYYRNVVESYPQCRAAFQFTLPDLQGPFSTAEMLWGSAIYPAFYDAPELVRGVLDRITTQMIAVYHLLAGQVRDSLGAGYCYQHAVGVKGSLLIRDDSMINLSPRMYRDFVLPCDQRLGRELASVGIHFCGNGSHQVENLLRIPEITSIDLGNPEKMDLDALYARTAPGRIALLRLRVPFEELVAKRIQARLPRGVSLVCSPDNVEHAHFLLDQYLHAD